MSTGDDQPTVIIEKDSGSEIGAFLLGALVGAGLALLFAPQSGRETQEQIRERAKQFRDVTEERVRGIRDDLGSRMETVKGVVDQGRQAAAEARVDLEHKLERSKAAYRAGVTAAREAAEELEEPDSPEPAEVES